MILNLDGQLGSGQATSQSVVIQSLGCVDRCLAAKRGSTAATFQMSSQPEAKLLLDGGKKLTEGVYRETLARWEV